MIKPRPLYCWFDTEYTTLELDRAKLLQVALIVTDVDLNPISAASAGVPPDLLRNDGLLACVSPPPREEISAHVKKHYEPLLARCEREGKPVSEIDELLGRYLEAFPESRVKDREARPVLAGNSVYADYFLARRFLPRFLKKLNYRLLDVTAFKIEWQLHYREPKFDKQAGADQLAPYYKGDDPILGAKHDAYYDVQASIAELGFYRSRFRKV